ncbi:multiheme c-type cytochrome [Breoghania sp.]|uniref:multiheme c-type cytochrome n=1 Tax=Breoghania sp. TaxID=2065378 RepID=UPI002AA6B1A4|nr:multiheme c-type cytochrome [Breoghania sp.]
MEMVSGISGGHRSAFIPFLIILASILAMGGSPAISAEPPKYVGSPACVPCHTAESENWQASDHAHAWMLPSPESVDADFNSSTFAYKGKTSRFFRKGEDFMVETDDVENASRTFKVVGVGGIWPLQQYLMETEPGRLQQFDVAWDQIEKKWFHIYADETPKPGEGLHWTGPYKTWNSRCAECHSTDYRKNYDIRTKRYHSMASEISVGCEACHGPGETHVAWANGKWSRDTQVAEQSVRAFSLDDQGLTISLKDGEPETEIQQCAGCHSRREALSDKTPLPGTAFHDAYRLSLVRQGLYHPDGQIKDEVYVYGSFLQSKMYANGVRCTDCHAPHTGKVRFTDNALCTQCHSPAGNSDFPSLTLKEYDTPAHTFHEPGTDGAACKSCHMISRIYMGNDARRDHSFRIPRPDLSVKIGTPNACNDCHTDKTASWAAEEIEKRFPDGFRRAPHYGEVFFAAEKAELPDEQALLGIARQTALPGIVRATALDLMHNTASPAGATSASELIDDGDPLVRAAAISVQQRARPIERIQRIAPALGDPVRSVRIAAARLMIGMPIAHLPQDLAKANDRAAQEWQASVIAKADFPEVHLVLGGTALVLRRPIAALSAFREATDMDPQLVSGWIMQVRIQLALGRIDGARSTLRKAGKALPDNEEINAYLKQVGQ